MNTLRRFSRSDTTVPAGTSWYLADLGEALGMQELFTRQAPQRLKALREHALIESAVSSNRIEGVTVEPRRVRELILGQPLLRDRDEEELRGYRVRTAYREFAERVGEIKAPRGAKTDLIAAAISGFGSEFTLSQLELPCPSVSRDMVRRVLRNQQAAGLVACQGRGPAARWRKG